MANGNGSEKLAYMLVSKLRNKMSENGADERKKLLREIDNRSKRNSEVSEALVRNKILPLLLQTLEDSRLSTDTRQRTLGIIVNVTCGLDSGKVECVKAALPDRILDEWLTRETDSVCKKWNMAILANVSTLTPVKTQLAKSGRVSTLVEILNNSKEFAPVRGITLIVLGNIMNEVREAAYEAFSRGICRSLLEIMRLDQKDCKSNAAYVLDIVLTLVPESREYYAEKQAYKTMIDFLMGNREELEVNDFLHVVCGLYLISQNRPEVLSHMVEVNFKEHLLQIGKQHRETLQDLDRRDYLRILLETLTEQMKREFSPRMVFNMGKNIDLEEESQQELGMVEKLRALSQTFRPTEELETLSQNIFEACKDDEERSRHFIKDGIVMELLKLINSTSRIVRKFSAATLAVVTRGLDDGIGSLIDYDGVSLLLHTIPTEEDSVIRRLLVTSLSNSLVNTDACGTFANNSGVGLFLNLMEQDPDSVTRSKAALGLGNFINQSNEFASDLVHSGCCEILLGLTAHPNAKCKNAAARTLGLILFKCPEVAIDRVLKCNGVETLLDTVELEDMEAEVKLPISWCLSQMVERNHEAKVLCQNREGILGELEKLRSSDYNRPDKSLLIHRLNILIELLSAS